MCGGATQHGRRALKGIGLEGLGEQRPKLVQKRVETRRPGDLWVPSGRFRRALVVVRHSFVPDGSYAIDDAREGSVTTPKSQESWK